MTLATSSRPGHGRSFGRIARCAALFLLIGLHACAPDEPDPGDPPSADEGIQVTAGLERTSFAPGDSIRVFVVLGNRLDAERTLHFPTAQRYELRVLDDGEAEVYRWSEDRSFAQAVGEERLPPRSEGPRWEEWIPAPERPGTYRIEVEVPAEGTDLRTRLPIEIGVDRNGAR